MTNRTQACVIDLDAASLLADETPSAPLLAQRSGGHSAVVVVAARVRGGERALAKPSSARSCARPAADVLPKPAGKGRRVGGRDEMLSEYLSSLGRIALLTADDEKDIASRFRDAEVRCWRRLLAVPEARAVLVDHPILHDATAELRARIERLRTGGGEGGDSDVVADALRDIDDDRLVIEEVIRHLHAATVRGAALEEVRTARRKSLELRNQFVRANLRLVVSVARRFHHYRLPLIDLIQEGNLGLIKSVHRFDHRKGFRFSTYAHWWIRQAIERAIMNKGAQVRLPVHVFDARREIAKATRGLHQSLRREPTLEELAKELHTPLCKLIETLRAVPRDPISLDDPVGDDEERTLGEVISDADATAPDEHVIQVDERRWVKCLLTRLSPMEVDIITRRYGLDADDDETLEEIGRSYNLSRERVRQIQVQGLKKIQAYVEVRLSAG